MKVILCTFDVGSLFLVSVCWLPHPMRSLWSCCLCLVSCSFWSLLEFELCSCDIRTVGRHSVQLVVLQVSAQEAWSHALLGCTFSLTSNSGGLGIRHLCRDPTCSVQKAFLQGLRGRAQGGPKSAWTLISVCRHSVLASESSVYCRTLFLL